MKFFTGLIALEQKSGGSGRKSVLRSSTNWPIFERRRRSMQQTALHNLEPSQALIRWDNPLRVHQKYFKWGAWREWHTWFSNLINFCLFGTRNKLNRCNTLLFVFSHCVNGFFGLGKSHTRKPSVGWNWNCRDFHGTNLKMRHRRAEDSVLIMKFSLFLSFFFVFYAKFETAVEGYNITVL